MVTSITTATHEQPVVRWHTIHFPEPAAWAAFRESAPITSCNPHLWRRWARAVALVNEGAVTRIGRTAWQVASQTTEGEVYAVVFPAASSVQAAVCECGDAVWRNVVWCKHALACFIAEHKAQQSGTATVA